MIRCIAIDDEPLALAVIRKYCNDTPLVTLEGTFTDAFQALTFLRTNKVDLLILDIQMPDISGIQFLQNLTDPPMVIFTTAYSGYAVKGFELEAVDYLLKPIRFERFLKAVEKAQTLMNLRSAYAETREEGGMFVKSGYATVRVNFSEILYIESFDDYVRIHFTGDRPPLQSLMSLKSIMETLPSGQFMRVHRSYIVSLNNVRSIRNKVIFLGEHKIPVGDTYLEAVQRWLGAAG